MLEMKKFGRIDSLPPLSAVRVGVVSCYAMRTLSVTVRCTYNSNARQPLRVNFYHLLDSTIADSVPFDFDYVDMKQGSQVTRTFIIPTPELGDIEIEVVNNDQSYSVQNIEVFASMAREKEGD